VYVPVLRKIVNFDCPTAIGPLLANESGDNAAMKLIACTASLDVHVTVSPTALVTVCGVNPLLLMVTV
jgi:hypothetical protein